MARGGLQFFFRRLEGYGHECGYLPEVHHFLAGRAWYGQGSDRVEECVQRILTWTETLCHSCFELLLYLQIGLFVRLAAVVCQQELC